MEGVLQLQWGGGTVDDFAKVPQVCVELTNQGWSIYNVSSGMVGGPIIGSQKLMWYILAFRPQPVADEAEVPEKALVQ